MQLLDGFDHQTGVHCGAAALRNVTAHYGWTYSEAAAFGIGGGPAFVLSEGPTEPRVTFRASPPWLERAFFERLGIPHRFDSISDFETAWENTTAHIDNDDPVMLFLDPASLDYLSDDAVHEPPHVAVLTGYDESTARLSDAATHQQQELSLDELAAAWASDRIASPEHESLVVTRTAKTEDETDAVAAALRQTVTYMLHPLQLKRDARGLGEEGLPALRSFADYLGRYPDLADDRQPVQAAIRGIDEHGDGTAFRGLYADALKELERRTNLTHDLADRMASVGEEWRSVGDLLEDTLTHDASDAVFSEAASLVGDIADQEAALFEDIGEQIGMH